MKARPNTSFGLVPNAGLQLVLKLGMGATVGYFASEWSGGDPKKGAVAGALIVSLAALSDVITIEP